MASTFVPCITGQTGLGWCQFSFVHIPPVFKRAGGGRDLNDYIILSRLDLWKTCQDPTSSVWSCSYQCGTFLMQKCRVCVLVKSGEEEGDCHLWSTPGGRLFHPSPFQTLGVGIPIRFRLFISYSFPVFCFHRYFWLYNMLIFKDKCSLCVSSHLYSYDLRYCSVLCIYRLV